MLLYRDERRKLRRPSKLGSIHVKSSRAAWPESCLLALRSMRIWMVSVGTAVPGSLQGEAGEGTPQGSPERRYVGVGQMGA